MCLTAPGGLFSSRPRASFPPCAISFGTDLVEGYRLLPPPGFRRDLVWGWGAQYVRLIYSCDPDCPSDPEDKPAADTAADGRPRGGLPRAEAPHEPRRPIQQLVFGHKLFIWCTPYTCSGACDKAHAGADFDGSSAAGPCRTLAKVRRAWSPTPSPMERAHRTRWHQRHPGVA